MRPLVAGNWKMNGLSRMAAGLAAGICAGAGDLACDLLLCPPFTVMGVVAQSIEGSPVLLGGQDCHAAANGAHTGDIAADMLADAGCSAVILGHSERRAAYHEHDGVIRAKAEAAMRAGLRPIVCVGESDDEREAGHQFAIVGRQIAGSLPDDYAGDIAYEPIWAIGSGRVPSVADIGSMHEHIREALVARLGTAGRAPRILYGGSVKAENAASLLCAPEVGGALIGGAALDAQAFLAIAQAAGRVCPPMAV